METGPNQGAKKIHPLAMMLATVRHSILDRKLVIAIHEEAARRAGKRFSAAEVARIPLATAARKCLTRMGFLPA